MTEQTSTREDLVHRYVATIWNNQELHRIGEFLAPDVRLSGLGDETPIVGRDAVVTNVALWLGLYSDVEMSVLQTVVDSDRVAWQWRLTGTVTDARLLASKGRADPEHVAPTDEISAVGISISTFRDGLIAEEVTQSGVAEFFGRLGYPPKPQAS